jgi:hypothetical protein
VTFAMQVLVYYFLCSLHNTYILFSKLMYNLVILSFLSATEYTLVLLQIMIQPVHLTILMMVCTVRHLASTHFEFSPKKGGWFGPCWKIYENGQGPFQIFSVKRVHNNNSEIVCHVKHHMGKASLSKVAWWQ